MNSVLKRYLKKSGLDEQAPPPTPESWQSFLGSISQILDQSDTDRRLMEHSLEKSSGEMMALYQDLKKNSEVLLLKEGQLRQSQKMEAIGSLAGGVAHDFNNLLAVIVCYADLSCDVLNPDDPLHKNIQAILHAAKRGSDLTRQLLTFSRQQVLQPKVIEISQVIEGMKGLLTRLIGETIELTFDVPADLYAIKADPGQLEQVIMNLVVNARDAMELRGKIHIEVFNGILDEHSALKHLGANKCSPSTGIFIEVTDTGSGMTEDVKARIFEPFFSTKEKGKGTGLGLATVLGIIEQSHGGIFVDSVPGKGSTFRVFLPKTDEAVTAEAESGKLDDLRGKETILVVEDEADLLDIVSKTLRSHGYNILPASSAKLAMELTLDRPVDLLLTDVVMPEIGGAELADTMHKQWHNLKVLFMSGYTDDAVLKHGVQSSEVAFLQKPFSARGLLQKVRETLNT
ncbi:MAG: ATP-binding protein [Myxococcota bacterium]